MNNDNLKSLRQTLLDSGYDTPEYDVFAKDMEDEENLKGVYETLKKEGYTPPEYDEFKRDMGWAEPAKPYNPSEDTMGAGVGAAIGNAIANPQPQQPQPEPQPKAQPAAKQGGYTPTWQEQMAMGITASRAAKTAKNATSGIDQQVQNQQTYQENVFSQTPEIGRQGHVVSDGEGYITDDATKHNVLVDANKQQQEADSYLEAMRKQREEYTEPTLWDSVSKSIGSGFIRVGTGILNSLQQLSSGMIVEDASKPTGYTKTQSYDEQLRDKNNAVTRGINSMHETADRLSRQAQPRNGKGFLDMLWDGDILGFLQKGVATAGESLPMTLSAFNPYTMVLNGISLAGNNYREQTLENPDIPEWKRFSMALGSAAIEQAVEKYADPVFKYIGGGKILKKAGKEASEEITKEVTKKATENLAKRIYKGMGGLAKDAAGEGIEEVVTNFGNDALGEILDKLSRNDEYGLEAQWAKMRKENPNATLWDFAQQKAKENVESFIGGAMAGAYTAGTTQLTTKGIEYGLNHMLNEQQIVSNPNAQLNPASVDIAQSFDEGYTLDNEQDIDKARAAYEEQRQRATEIFGEIRGLDEQPLKTIETMQQGGFTPEQIQAAYDYISAKATFDGVQQRMTEDTKRSRVDSYNVSGNTIEELDSEGNVIGTHEYENQDEMKLGLFELQQTRANNDMLADRAVMILDPKYDYDTALASFAEETGVDPEYLESIMKTDPMERTEAEQQMVSEFAETIHNILYDNTTLHEDQSAEDGADLAEMMGIDLDDADGTQAQQITDSYNAASTALNELFARNEDLKQEVQSREQQGMPHQGIIASLDSFRPEDVQTVTDFYNRQAKFNGFLNRMSQKIGEEAANRRQRHTLNGTINGQADVRNVHTITDGTNTYYLVSGNITTDSSGRITDSDSGLIIGMDEDGNFVNIGDTNGYSVMPVTQSLDQWEEDERTRLQEEWTAKIDPTGSMMQPQPVPEAAETGTQETENVPQTEGFVTQQPEPQQQVQIPIDEKSGLKRYEQGVPSDQTIQDIQNDGFDVDEMADAYIAEAQETIDKINKKDAKKPLDLIERKRQQGIIDYYKDVKSRYAELNQPAESEENVNVQPNQPTVKGKTVSSQQNKTAEEQKQKRIAEAKAKYGELFDDDFTKANDVYELVSMWIGRGRSLNRDSVGQELGWNMGIGRDARYIETLLAKKGEGVSINAFVHGVWESPENSVEGEKRFTTEEIREAVLDLLSSARSKSDVVDYALNTRIAQAEANLQEQQRREEDEIQEAGKAIDDTTPIDINWDEMPFLPMSQEQIEESDRWFETSNNTEYDERTEAGNDELADEYMPDRGGEVSGVQESETNSGQEQPDVSGSVEGNQSEEPSETGGGEVNSLRGSDGSLAAGSRTDRTASEVQGQVDEYLQPRNAEEEQIIANVIAQLQQEIGDAVEDANKARAELEKARAKESDRATDMFANDQTFAEPDAIFSQEEMGLDTSAEGVERRTAPQREKLQEATNKLNRLQSLEERNSRIRGALDNYRRQTTIEAVEQPQSQSREDYLASHPLTEEQIMADTEATEDEKLNAIDFLKGEDDSAISRFYYDSIYERVQDQKPIDTEDPIEAIDEAARIFNKIAAATSARNKKRQEQKSQDQQDIDDALKEFNDFLDNAKGSNVLDKFMRKGLDGNDKAQASLLDAFTLTNEAQRMFLKDLLRLASKVGYAYIKSGIHDAQAWSKKMSESIGAKLKEVLGWDDTIIGEFVDEVWNQKYTVDGQRMRLSEHAERLNNGNVSDHAVNEHKQENNEAENVVSSQQKPASELEGDSAEFSDRQKKEKALRDDLKQELLHGVSGDRTLKTMQDVKKLAEKHGLDMSLTDLQEIVEAVIVDMARNYANNSFLTDKQKFDNIVALYQTQPTLSARDNDRINMQQYSTAAPMAYLMGRFADPDHKAKSGLEPSAGNGMLTIALPKEIMHVNDIDEMRLSNLAKQGFKEVTSQDGTQPFGEKQYDVVVTNPPFGNVTPKVFDGVYEISGLEHLMTINALESMKDDGRAAIIIGGNTDYNTNGTIKGKDRAFLNYLYAHYNVVDVINMDGKTLYSRQGTGFPVRMILINGRKEFNVKDFAPVQSKARAEQVKSYDELYKRVNDDILSDSNKPASVRNTESGESRGVDDNANAGNTTQTGVRNVRTEGGSSQPQRGSQSGSSVQRSDSTTNEQTKGQGSTNVGGGLFDVGSRTEASQSSGSTAAQADNGRAGGSERRDDTERPASQPDNSQRVGQRGAGNAQPDEQPAVKRGLGTEKVPYRKQSSNPFTLQSLMPAEQADVVKKALEDLGDVDQFLVDELGYSSKEELHQALAAEQIDSVSMAIHQMNQGSAFIIGDQTGIGKGRQAAALIRYGVKKGSFPVFITVKKALFSDMYRDLCDIGSPELRPFIWSADDTEHSGNVTDKDGNVVYQTPNAKEQKRVVDYINKNGKLPPEYDYVLTTYDSFKSGTMDYENGTKKARSFGKKQPSAVHFNGQAKRDALEKLAGNSYVIMDESHNAGGEGSNVSNYLQYITTKAKGLTFLSATFAKRPGNMPIYSLKTAIAKAGVAVDELIDAVKRGGATFQEIMSKALTEAGQMIRRERSMEGVTIDWRGIEDESVIQKQREQYDTIIGLFNEIISFQRTYVDPIVDKLNDDAAEEQGEVEHTPGTRDMGINNTPFASRTYNMVQQVLLSLKAEEAAKRAIEHLKLGRKPVITVANTNEGAADEVSTGEDMEMPDLSVNLKKGLQGTLRITKKDAFGNTVKTEIPFDRLSKEGQNRYREIMDNIENASSGLSLSPIDVIKNELKKAGYKIGELTGRKAEFVYNEDGTVKRVKRQDTDKKKVAADFNNGKLDALILNRSAGTGISLHASTKFKDQRQRIMIVAQAQGDVNDEVQIRGRIDRTGQVLRGMYEYVVSQIPSEQRLLMMLKAKLRSLDANTTSSQKSKFNEMQVQDIINKYGDDVVIQYLAEHPDIAMKMCDPLKWGEGAETLSPEALVAQAQKPSNGGDGATASKVLGRMALLTVREQEKMLQEIGDLYTAEIDRLNEMGENDLEITEMPLRAKTLKKDIWEEGVEPGGKNPFADNSYVEEVEMDVLRKPMKAEEVKKSQARLLGGKTWEEYKQGVLDKVDEWAEQKKAETTQTFTERAEKKANAEKEKYAKGAKKAQEKNGMTDAEIERNAGYQYDTFYKQEMDKLKDATDAVEKQKQAFVDALETFSTDGVYALPTDIYDLSQITFEPSFGKVIDIKIADNFSTAASTISFATLDGRRKITIPISGMVKQQNGEKRDIKPSIVQQTAQARSGFFGSNIANMLKVLGQNVDNWDKLTSTAARKKGYIITGNLLKALTSLRNQGKGGKLISYTTDTGDIRQGILMSDQFDPGALTSKNPISSEKDQLNFPGDKIVSSDKEVTVKKDGWGQWYKLQVPKSKKKGDKYYNDKTILSLMDGQFEGSTQMSASFTQDKLDAVLKRLDELGVTVEAAKANERDERDVIDPIKAIEEAAYAFRSENGYPKKTEEELAEITERVMGIPKRFGLKGAVTQVINSRDELERMKGKVSDEAYRLIEMGYNKPGVTGLHISGSNIVVVFGEKVEDADEAELTWWHEQTHNFWHSLPQDLKDSYGAVCFNILQKYYPETFDILVGYGPSKWKNEACSFLAESIIKQYGADKFMATKFDGNGIFVNFANELRDYLKNGKESNGRVHGNSRRRGNESQSGKADSDGRDNLRQERQGGSALHQENTEEVDFRISDPLEAIRRAADGFRDGQTNNPANHSAKAIYDDRLNRVETVFSEAYQDAMVSLKTAQNAIAGDKEIPDSQNAYMAENLMHGKNKNEMDLFNRMFRDPLIQTINRIMNLTGMNWGDIDRYVYTKSGLERNREFFVRDWLEAERKKIIKSYEDLNPEEQEIFDRKADTIETLFEDGDIETEEQKEKELDKALQESHNEYVDDIEQRWQALKRNNFIDLNDGAIDFADYIAGLDNFIRDNIDENYVGAEHDYSGFRAMYGDEDGKYDEDKIINELMNNEDMMEAENVDTLWNQIRECTMYGLERYRGAGMRTDEQIDRVEQMFHWYVPMRGFKDNMGEDMYQYFTGKDKPKSYVGGLLKHAKGRGSEANYPISTIFSMTYKAISDCNQNLVNQKFYRLCQANPNDLVILSDSWAVLNETTGEWEEVAPDIPEDADEEDVRQITEAWEESMRQLANEGKAKKIKGKEQFDYKPVDKKKQSEHIVDVRINGQPRKMIVTGNPRMAQALNGQLRFENGKNVFSKWNSAIKNFMASVFTSYSPTFALRNMFRDWTHFRTMLGVREGRGYAKQADKYYRQSLFKMVGLFKKYRNGTLDESKEMERDFKDFMDNGGITGFVFMQKIDDIQKEMEDIYKKQKAGKTIRLNNNMWEKILGAVEALNEGIENNARFATYRASRHYAGRTKARSAYDAKEITVNFNRKGAGGKTAGFKSQRKVVEDAAKAFGITSQILGEGRIFFNATVQAIATTFKNFQNADGSLNKPYIAKWAAKYALPPFLFGLALPMINKALANAFGGDDGDDDPYANIPEWTRRKNLCFYIGNGNFITIPIGQELAAFLTLGDIMAGNTYAPDLKPVDRSWDDEILGVMNTFSPVDVDTKITKGGLMEDPISEVTGRTFSVLAPLVAVEQNLGWTGRPIYREDIYPSDKYNPEYQMVYRSTNPVMVGASKLANDLSGGDDVVRGKIQVNPAIVQYLWEQYTGGPGKVFSNTISIGKDAKDILSGNESDFNIRKVEGLKAFVQQGDDRTAYYRTQAKYRKYLDDAKKLKDAVNGYKKAAETDPLAPAKLEKISASEDYVRMERILEADKELSKINKAANKAEGQERRELRRQYNQGVKEVVDELDNIPGEQ